MLVSTISYNIKGQFFLIFAQAPEPIEPPLVRSLSYSSFSRFELLRTLIKKITHTRILVLDFKIDTISDSFKFKPSTQCQQYSREIKKKIVKEIQESLLSYLDLINS